MPERAPNPDKKENISFTLSPEAIGIIDGRRGQTSRSSFVDNWPICTFSGKVE